MSTKEKMGNTVLETMTPQETKERFDRNEIVLIDVRTPVEYAFEHIAGAMLFPMSSFQPEKLPAQAGKPIVFHCGSGKRSHIIAEKCAAAGLTQIAHIEGGFGAWKIAKLPYLAMDPSTGSLVRSVQ